MFDYDARPVLVGTTASRSAYAIRDFLSRNGYPFEWVDAGDPEAVRAVLQEQQITDPVPVLGEFAWRDRRPAVRRARGDARQRGPRWGRWFGGSLRPTAAAR